MKLRSCWILLSVLLSVTVRIPAASPADITLNLTETAGVHRDHAPVHVLLTLPHAAPATTPFRLRDGERSVVAQFRPVGAEATSSEWWLDFLADSKPYESRNWVVEYGEGVERVPERTTGHQLKVMQSAFDIRNDPYISWTIPRDFRGFLSSVNFPPSEHLRSGGAGLTLVDRDGQSHQLGGAGTSAQVVRHGRMAVALRFGNTDDLPGLHGVRWTADLTFPGPISWVDLQLQIDDPEDRVAVARLQLNLNLNIPTAAQRTIVELGADRTVYRSLFGNAQVALTADSRKIPSWQVSRSTPAGLQPFAVASAQSTGADGWAHVMDRQRCLAIAFEQFGEHGPEELIVSADGQLSASRKFALGQSTQQSTKHWRTWLHFVHFPPQQSAATDPQMMQSPLMVRQVTP